MKRQRHFCQISAKCRKIWRLNYGKNWIQFHCRLAQARYLWAQTCKRFDKSYKLTYTNVEVRPLP